MEIMATSSYDNNSYFAAASAPAQLEIGSFFDTAPPTGAVVDLTAAKDYTVAMPSVKPSRYRYATHRYFSETSGERYVPVSTLHTVPAYTSV
jgi:hypothetical protein